MSWFLLAIIGHLSNGAAFIIDKILLQKAFKRSATYAGLIGTMSGVVLFAIPFVKAWPVDAQWLLALVSGMTFVLGLWTFFSALSRAEASRVVPIIGSLIPIMTLAGTYLFLNERLAERSFVGFGLLILATILLSKGGKGKLDHLTVWIAVLSAFLFAFASVTGKATYDLVGFLGGFVTTRIGALVMALVIVLLLDRTAGKELMTIFHPKNRTTQKQEGKTALLALCGQGLGATGFVFVQWATSQGSAAIVNAMQAIQYALLVIVALILRNRAPNLLGEDLSRKALAFKIFALAIAGLGMYLIV